MLSCRPPTGWCKLKRLPVFEPNEFFFKHHWDSKKESRAEAYCRVVRSLMLKHSGLKDAKEFGIAERKEYGDILSGKIKI